MPFLFLQNGASRSLCLSLECFSALFSLTRPQKCQTLSQTLLPVLLRIIQRKEESIHEHLIDSLPLILPTMTPFLNSAQVQASQVPAPPYVCPFHVTSICLTLSLCLSLSLSVSLSPPLFLSLSSPLTFMQFPFLFLPFDQEFMTTILKVFPNSSASFRRMAAVVLSSLCVNCKQPHSRADWIISKLLGWYFLFV